MTLIEMSYDPSFNRQNPNIMGDLMRDITDFMKMRDRSNSTEKRQREADQRMPIPEKHKPKKRHVQHTGLLLALEQSSSNTDVF